MQTRSGIPLQSYYSNSEAKGEIPGEFPFTRGRMANPLAQGSWIQRELSGEGNARASNKQIHYLLDHGQMGIDVIGDSPTQALMDPDHPLAIHSVGTQGVSLCCQEDYLDLFDNVPFAKTSISSSVPPVMALAGLTLAAENADVPLNKLRGSILQPPLYSEDCCYAMHLPVDLRVRLSLDAMEYCAEVMPRFHSYVEDTYFFAESGLDAVEEMALGFVQIRHLSRKLIQRGISVDKFAPRIAILVNCGMDFFEEIAKIRATRRLFAKMMKEEFGAEDPRSLSVVISSHTSGMSLTAQQPANNIIRGTLQALSLVLGGVQALEVSAFDEAFRTPSREAHLLGLRTQQIIDLESGAAKVADPLGGSYFIEDLTDKMAAKIWERVQQIEALGDPEDLCRDGYFRDIFLNAMQEAQRVVDTGEFPLVGVNIHKLSAEDDTLLKNVAEEKLEPCLDQVDLIRAFKKNRDISQLKTPLSKVKEATKEGQNLVPVVIDSLKKEATVGEITGAMRLAVGQAYDPLGHLETPEFLS